MGGAAYAASVPPNSVGTKQLKSESVTAAKVRNDAITTAKIKDGTLLAQDFSPGALPKEGPPGPTGKSGGTDTTILWAVVRAGEGIEPDVLERGHHAVSVNRKALGIHEVTFNQDVSDCAYFANLGGYNPTSSPAFFLPVSFSVNSKQSSPDTVIVTTAYQSSGVPQPVDDA